MVEVDRPLLAQLREELSGVAGEASHLAALRWRLAEIELRQSAATVRRFSVWALVAAAFLLTSLPMFAVALSAWLLPGLGWAWTIGLALAIAGLATAALAWRRFRRDFHGLEQSIEELREDLQWVKEWSARPGR